MWKYRSQQHKEQLDNLLIPLQTGKRSNIPVRNDFINLDLQEQGTNLEELDSSENADHECHTK